TRDDRFICIGVESTVSSEVRCAPAADPVEFSVLAARERDVEYDADHHGGRWVIRTNAPQADGTAAPNFRLMTAPSDARSRAEWQERIAHDEDVVIGGVAPLAGFPATDGGPGGLDRSPALRADGRAQGHHAGQRAHPM